MRVTKFHWILLAFALSSLTGAEEPAPRLTVEPAVFNFGRIVRGPDSVEGRFTLRNDGAAPLRIERVRNCCGVTVKLEREDIQPGEAVSLSFTFSLTDRRGPQRKTLYLHTNDPAAPVTQLLVVGMIAEPPAPVPAPIVATPP